MLSFFVVPRSAGAVGLVLYGETTHVRMVVAPAGARTVRWYSISVAETRPLLWVIPTGKNAVVDVGSPAWLDALDAVTALRVIPSCGSAAVETIRGTELGAGGAAPSIDTVTTPEELDAKIDDPYLPPEVRNDLVARLATQNLVLLRTSGPHTPTLRVVDDDGAMPVPMSLVQSPRAVDVTAFVVAEQASMLGTSVPGPASIAWYGGRSDYLLKRDGALSGSPPGSFIVETLLSSAFDRAQQVGNITIPSVPNEYLARVASYGGNRNDVELALAQRAPSSLFITRLAGRLAANASSPDLAWSTLPSATPEIVRVATATCGSGGGGGGGGGGTSPPPTQNHTYEGAGCSGGTSSSGSSRGTNSGTSSSSEGCSSDSTSGSGSSNDDDESCSSDTTDSSDSPNDDDEGCSSDTTDSGSDDTSDESCDSDDGGGSSDDEEDDACDGSEAKKKNTSRSRSPVSRSVLGFALFLLPLRRLGRRKVK